MTPRVKPLWVIRAVGAGWLACGAAGLWLNAAPWPWLALWLAAGLGGGVWLDRWLARRVFQPLADLAQQAQDPAAPPAAADDLTRLTAALHGGRAMLTNLQARAVRAEAEQALLQMTVRDLHQAAGSQPLGALLERLSSLVAERYGYVQARLVWDPPTDIAPAALPVQAALPLRLGDRRLGTLELLHRTPIPCPPERQAALQLLADQIALVADHQQRLAQQQRRLQLEALALALTGRLQQLHEPEAILESAATELGRALGARRAIVRLEASETPSPRGPAAS